MGKKAIVLTDEEIELVREKSSRLTQKQIADLLGIGERTFREIMTRQPAVSTAYKKGKAKVIDDIASKLVEKALNGDTTSILFYLKTQAGWRETEDARETVPINIVMNSPNDR
jgi:predicted DNA-binding protein (UPF0251 family)